MQGFMEKMNLEQYCIPLKDLSTDVLNSKFEILVSNYGEYHNQLISKHLDMKNESYKTTEIAKEIIDKM